MWSISILCYNKLSLTQACIQSLLKWTPQKSQLILTNNGSTDGTQAYLESLVHSKPPFDVTLVHHEANLGVIKSKIAAFKLAKHPFFISLDNDCTVHGRWVERLHEPFRGHPRMGQVGRTGCFQHLDHRGNGKPEGPVDYIDGSCFMVRVAAARDVGGICDPVYEFCWCEDSDLSLRLRKKGWRITTVDVPVKHKKHQTSHHGGMDLSGYYKKNHALFVRRWHRYLETRRF